MTDLRTTAAVKQEDQDNLLPDTGVTVMTQNHRQSNENIMDTLVGVNSDEGVVGRLIDTKLQAYTPPAPTPHTEPVPFITDFVARGISNIQDAPYMTPTDLIFDFQVHNPGSVAGNLSIFMSNTELATDIVPTSNSIEARQITSVTLQDGESVTFSLRGIATNAAGGQPFKTDLTIRAQTPGMTHTPTFSWRSGMSGDWTDIMGETTNNAFFIDPIVESGDSSLQFRVDDNFQITEIANCLGSQCVDETSSWTVSTPSGFRVYTFTGLNNGNFHYRILIGV